MFLKGTGITTIWTGATLGGRTSPLSPPCTITITPICNQESSGKEKREHEPNYRDERRFFEQLDTNEFR
jgi:hypothetical protein